MHAVHAFTPNSVQVLGYCEDPMAICMEKYDMSLDKFIFKPLQPLKRQSTLTLRLSDVSNIMHDVCKALNACEELSIVHNDLKPCNFKHRDRII